MGVKRVCQGTLLTDGEDLDRDGVMNLMVEMWTTDIANKNIYGIEMSQHDNH
jgi:hypothetical protein